MANTSPRHGQTWPGFLENKSKKQPAPPSLLAQATVERYPWAMIKRIKRYYENCGPFQSLFFFGVVAFMFYRQFQYGNAIGRSVMISIFVICFLAPILVIPMSIRNPYRATRIAGFYQYALMFFIAISYFNVLSLPGIAYLGITFSVFVYIGWGFWFFSSPALATARGYVFDQDRALDSEERYLKDEVEQNAGLLGHERDES